MKPGALRDYFLGVAAKRLTAADSEPKGSRGREFPTTKELRRWALGETKQEDCPAAYLELDGWGETRYEEGAFTHGVVRESRPHRGPEWRLFFPSNAVTRRMHEGDSLFLARGVDGRLHVIATAEGSSPERRLCQLFDLRADGERFAVKRVPEDGPELDFADHFALRELGREIKDANTDWLDPIIRNLKAFPKPADFSALARASSLLEKPPKSCERIPPSPPQATPQPLDFDDLPEHPFHLIRIHHDQRGTEIRRIVSDWGDPIGFLCREAHWRFTVHGARHRRRLEWRHVIGDLEFQVGSRDFGAKKQALSGFRATYGGYMPLYKERPSCEPSPGPPSS